MNIEQVAAYEATERLKDQRSVTIRAIRPDDKGLVTEALREVSRDSIYKRFFGPKKEITADGLRRVTEVDFTDVVALVAVVELDGTDHIAGGGRYVRIPSEAEGRRAEVAFLVADPFQGLGIASSLFKHLVAIARASGITRFEAEVLPHNEAMLRVFTGSGLSVTTRLTADSVQLSMELQGGKS